MAYDMLTDKFIFLQILLFAQDVMFCFNIIAAQVLEYSFRENYYWVSQEIENPVTRHGARMGGKKLVKSNILQVILMFDVNKYLRWLSVNDM